MSDLKDPGQIIMEAFNLDGTPYERELPPGTDVTPVGGMGIREIRGGTILWEWICPDLNLMFRAWLPSTEEDFSEPTIH